MARVLRRREGARDGEGAPRREGTLAMAKALHLVRVLAMARALHRREGARDGEGAPSS